MSEPDPISLERYRRRILGLGAIALVVTFAIGTAIFVPVVQNDLKNRVEDELVEAGIPGVRASFSGQDGTLTCTERLEDPDDAQVIARDVHGVRVIDLDASCSRIDPSTTDPPTTEETEPAATDVVVTEPVGTTAVTVAAPATEPEIDAIVDIVDGDPLFDELADLLATAGLDGDDALGGDGPFTLLAPTDDAFDAAFDDLGADAFNALTSDSEVLRAVLLHHATNGAITSTDFVAGDLEMLDGTSIVVDPDAVDGIAFTSEGPASGVDEPATQLDIVASNGVVHAIDRLLIPEGLDLADLTADGTTIAASFVGGQIALSGVVQTEDQRVAVVTGAQAQLDQANIIDDLVVDLNVTLGQAGLDRFAALIAAMPPNLVDGEASLVGDDLMLTGTYLDAAARVALEQVGAGQEATLDLSARQAADPDSAAALQSELNDFVRDNPILFEPNSATLTGEANAVIEQLTARAGRLDGTTIIIVGHTDSDGNPATNQTLSELRAASVLDALAQRGLDATTLSSAGRGSTEPITDASGAEDKAASRRVEFVVEAS